MEHKLVKLIPEKALYAVNGKNLLNYEMIRGQMKNTGRENRFLERFVDTQMLTFSLPHSLHMKNKPCISLKQNLLCQHTSKCSKPHIPSTCLMRAVLFPSLSVQVILVAFVI